MVREDRVGQLVQQATAFDWREQAPFATVSGLASGSNGFANVLGVTAGDVREDLPVARVEHRDGLKGVACYALVVYEVGCHSVALIGRALRTCNDSVRGAPPMLRCASA